MNTRAFSVLLDAHGLSALATDAAAMRTWLALVKRTGSELYVSTVTIAEATDGTSRDVNVRRALKGVNPPIPPSEPIAFEAGRLRAAATASRRKPRDLTIDALVAATALTLRPPVVVLTSDTPDLDLLLAGTSVQVRSLAQ
ncbi:MAG: twitching motility protein PilT [Micrococcales bacterium]|nr:twitching motility protein PilT [Micrococcales bacterium]MCL2668713.1 twitching motility protein PilT [Micrococcales bacterium]